MMSVIILAGAPIACGTQTPSAPEAISLVSDGEGTVESSALRTSPGPRTCIPGDRTQIKRIAVKVVDSGPGFATVRAVATESASDTVLPLCLTPSWVVSPSARVDTSHPEQATIYATPGKYSVTATTVISRAETLSAKTRIYIEE
jgi:hypothetical protein